MANYKQLVTALSQSSPSEVVRTPLETTERQRTIAPTLNVRSLEQPQSIGRGVGREAALKVLNSVVQDPQFSELADDQTENFIRQIIKQGAGGETVKQLSSTVRNTRQREGEQGAGGGTLEQLSLAISKYQFLEILQRMAKREKMGLSYQVRQLLSTKADALPSPKIGCIWA